MQETSKTEVKIQFNQHLTHHIMHLSKTYTFKRSTETGHQQGFTVKKITLAILSCFIAVSTIAQEANIRGAVIDEGNRADLANAIVTIEGTALAQTTNENGKFSFNEKVPAGEHVVTVSKKGYESNYFLIDVVEGKKLVIDQVKMTMTKDEKKRRKKMTKSSGKESKKAEKERESKLKEAKKEGEKKNKELAKEEKKLKSDGKRLFGLLGKKKKPEVEVTYEAIEETPEVKIDPLQRKYAAILGVPAEEITNIELYAFIDEWMGTPYKMGGEAKSGIDCSSFAQRLFIGVYDWYIERTAQKQMDSEATVTWSDPEFLVEGDFLFFRAAGDYGDTITHVGVYLGNNKFVNATSRAASGGSGVKISDLSDPFWRKRFFAGGRRVHNKG